MTLSPTRILVADDDPFACEAIRLYLDQSGFEVVGFAHDGSEAVRLAEELQPDVVLLDVSMPEMDGLEALAAVKSSLPQTTAIILTAHCRSRYVARAIAHGAGAYITKGDLDLERISETISAVVEGNIAIVEQDLLKAALEVNVEDPKRREARAESSFAHLTSQERKVLTLMADGLSNEQIAQALFVSYNTVKTHARNVFAKLGVSDRTQAAIMALRSGLMD